MVKLYSVLKDESTKEYSVINQIESKALGYNENDLELGYNGKWYLQGYAPEKPIPTNEEQRQARANAYAQEVDPITAHIQRLKDESPIPEGEIAELIAERDAKVQEIKERYPYYE